MTRWHDYYLAQSVADALHALRAHDGQARVIAGGTDLLLDLEEGDVPPPVALVDVSRIEEMTAIYRQGDHIYVGAAATHAQIVASGLLREHATCLVESCGVIGGPQVRNVATIGGNVAHALPAADGTVSLVALEAEAQVARLVEGGHIQHSWLPILDLFLGPGRSAVDPTRELITAFRFSARRPHEGSAFDRIMRPQGVALPILGMAASRASSACTGWPSRVRSASRARKGTGPAGPMHRLTWAKRWPSGVRRTRAAIPNMGRATP